MTESETAGYDWRKEKALKPQGVRNSPEPGSNWQVLGILLLEKVRSDTGGTEEGAGSVGELPIAYQTR